MCSSDLKEAKAIKSGRITPQQYAREERKEERSMKMKKMASGGMAASGMGKVVAGGKRAHGEHTVQQKGHTKGKQVVMAGNKNMKRGGKC